MVQLTYDVHMGYRAHSACARAPRMCRSRYCWRARECACWTCSLRGLSARAVRARSWRHNPSRRRKQPAAAPCKPGACRAPPTAVLEVPVTSWTTTAGLAKRGPPNISMACVQEGRGAKVSAVRRAAGALQEAKCTRAAHTGRPSEVWGTGLRWRRGSPHVWPECEAAAPELASRSVPSVPTPPAESTTYEN